MAILGRIRKHPFLLIIIIGGALAAFILGDFIKKRPRRNYDVGKVNGTEITYKEFNSKVEENTELYKQNAKKSNLTYQEQYTVKQNTWDQILNKIIMDEEFEKVGLSVSSDELFDLVQGKDPHPYIRKNFKDPKTNKYNPELVLRYLQNLETMDPVYKNQWLELERYIKNDRINQKFNNLIKKAYFVPTVFAKKNYEAKTKKADIRCVAVKYSTIADSLIKVTDNDYEKYYKENINKFKQKESRDIEYVVFDVKPSKLDREQTDKEVKKLFEEFKETKDVPNFVNATSEKRYDSTFVKKNFFPVELDSALFSSKKGSFIPPFIKDDVYYMAKLMDIQNRPDSIKASHILISYKEANVDKDITRTKEEAKLLADSLYKVLRRSPKKFNSLVVKFSNYPEADKNKGDLGWLVDGDPNFSLFFNAALRTKTGHFKIVESRLGYHVLKVTEKTKYHKKVQVALISRSIEPSSQTFQNVFIEASKFAGEHQTAEAFNKGVADLGLTKRTKDNIKKMDNQIPGISNTREIIHWIYKDGTDIGDISKVFDDENKYIVVLLKAIHEKGYTPLKEIKSRIKYYVTNEKKAEYVIDKMNKALKSTKDINVLAKKLNTKVDTIENITFSSYNLPGYGREQNVIGSIFSLDKGKISKPIKGKFASFIVIVDNIKQSKGKKDYSSIKKPLINSYQSRVDRESYNVLKEKADIKDNRIQYY
ncbi:MAG: SurA N-terminal domain-containing protein [Bacteroidales bacterium]|nr:SurA N-terminal domain-containing protein [Bacteroidales bacterium]